MKPIDLSKILIKYKKGWIALTPDNRKFVALGETLEEVLAKADKKGISNPSVFKTVPVKNLYIG